jgi:predicted  nucleic acid-binding Zn-ribbon protein
MRKWSTTAGVYGAFRGETKNIRKELGEISESIADAAHKLATETNPDKRVALELNLRELQDRRRDIQERLTELREASRNM